MLGHNDFDHVASPYSSPLMIPQSDTERLLTTHLAGEGAAGLLDSYSVERSAVGDMVLRNASRLTTMATLSSPAIQAARNLGIRVLLGFPAVRHGMATQMSETAIGHPKSPLSEGAGAGARLAPAVYDEPTPGAGRMPCFVLYATGTDRATRLVKEFAPLREARIRCRRTKGGSVVSGTTIGPSPVARASLRSSCASVFGRAVEAKWSAA